MAPRSGSMPSRTPNSTRNYRPFVYLLVGVVVLGGLVWLKSRHDKQLERGEMLSCQFHWEYANKAIAETEAKLAAEQQREKPDPAILKECEYTITREKAKRKAAEDESQRRWGKHPRDL